MPRNLNEKQDMGNQEENIRSGSTERQQGQDEQNDINVNNPQKGSSWNNYQSRELSDNEEGRMSAEEASQAFEEE